MEIKKQSAKPEDWDDWQKEKQDPVTENKPDSDEEQKVRPAHSGDDDDNQQETDEKQSEQTQQILEVGSVTPVKGKHVVHCLTIIGQVEGHYILPAQNKTTKYEHVIPQLVAIEQDPQIEGLIIILNTVGGDVEAGLAIAELIAGMSKPTVSLVLGGGHSIGVPLACSGKYSMIAPSATMTIHPVRLSGLVLGVPQTLSYFEKMQERIVRFVTENSKISAERFRELMMKTGEMVMDVGTVLDGEAAVAEGLIDELGGLSEAVTKLYELIEEKQKKDAQAAKALPAARGKKPEKNKKQAEKEQPKAAEKSSRGRGKKPAQPAAQLPPQAAQNHTESEADKQ